MILVVKQFSLPWILPTQVMWPDLTLARTGTVNRLACAWCTTRQLQVDQPYTCTFYTNTRHNNQWSKMNLFKLRLGNCDMYKFLFTLSLYFSSSFLSSYFRFSFLRDNDWFFYAWRIFQWHPTQSYAARNEKTYRWQRYSQKRDNGRWPVHVSLLTMIWFDDHVKTIPKQKQSQHDSFTPRLL